MSAPLAAQTLDDLLGSGNLPADAQSAPPELVLGYGVNSAVRLSSELTLIDDREHGFCFAKNDGRADMGPILGISQTTGGSMGISLHCDDAGTLPALGQMHTHPSFSVGLPSVSDFAGIDPHQTAFLVVHPVDGETTAIVLTRAAREQNTLADPAAIASASAVMRVMMLEFLQGAQPNTDDRSAAFSPVYLSAICGRLSLACYYRSDWTQKFTKVDGLDGMINTAYDAEARHRGFVRVQILLDWISGKDFKLPEDGEPLAINSMKDAMTALDALGPRWQGATMYTSPHVIMNVGFPSKASDNFVGLAIPRDNNARVMEKGGTSLRTFNATADASDPNAAISGCIRLGDNVTISGARYDDALFGDISSGSFQHHCFSLKTGSGLELTANETVADGYMTTMMTGGEVIKTALADFCPATSREKIVFCNKKPSFTVP